MSLRISRRFRRRSVAIGGVLAAVGLAVALVPSVANANAHSDLDSIDHIVVIYEENHSFDNLFGGWERVNGLDDAAAPHTTQVARTARRYLPAPERRQPHLAAAADHLQRHGDGVADDQPVRERAVQDRRLHPARRTRPARRPGAVRAQRRARTAAGLPGGCTRDLVHRFYNEQYQIDGGRQDRYVDRQRRRRPDAGLLRHHRAADLPVPARPGRAALRRSPTTSSRRPSAARSSTTSG